MLSPSEQIAALAELLAEESIPFALIGGWAVISWGFLRTSDDIDFLVELPASKRKALLAALAKDWNARWEAGGEDDPLVGLVRAEPKQDQLPVDFLVAGRVADRHAIERAMRIELAGRKIPLVRPEDLIAMKLGAGSGQDYEDARRLLELLAEKIDEKLLAQCCKERRVTARLALARSKS